MRVFPETLPHARRVTVSCWRQVPTWPERCVIFKTARCSMNSFPSVIKHTVALHHLTTFQQWLASEQARGTCGCRTCTNRCVQGKPLRFCSPIWQKYRNIFIAVTTWLAIGEYSVHVPGEEYLIFSGVHSFLRDLRFLRGWLLACLLLCEPI
jgi:hypothetical protein